MVYLKRLKAITGKTVKDWYGWLVDEQCGCCHAVFADDATWNWSVCMGWHSAGARGQWTVAWKIGRQTRNNIMQTDLDLDFEMPYDPETGDVDDTLETLDDVGGWTAADWRAVAKSMRETAVAVYNRWKDDKEAEDA